MLCFVLALGSISISLSHSLSLFLSPFIVFVVDVILTVIVEYFWDLHCLAVWLLCVTFVYSFWYLQFVFVLLLFIRGHNIDNDKQWNIFVGICIVCLCCVSLLFIRGHYIDFDKS